MDDRILKYFLGELDNSERLQLYETDRSRQNVEEGVYGNAKSFCIDAAFGTSRR